MLVTSTYIYDQESQRSISWLRLHPSCILLRRNKYISTVNVGNLKYKNYLPFILQDDCSYTNYTRKIQCIN